MYSSVPPSHDGASLPALLSAAFRLSRRFALLGAAALGCAALPAQPAATATPAEDAAVRAEAWAKALKNPTPWLSWGADVRLRNEYLNSAISLNDTAARHEQDYLRYRGRVWATAVTPANVSVNARLSGEPRTWVKDSFSGTFGPGKGYERRYGLLDNLYVKWTNAFDAPLTLSAGRQDIQFGEPLTWWLVADGTPCDGSWTFYLDSVRATWEHKDSGTKLDVVALQQSARPDRWLPTLGRTRYRGYDYVVTDQDEQGAIVYLSTRPSKNATADGYWIYKQDTRASILKAGLPALSGDNAHLSTFGARLTGTPSEHLSYAAEAAYQTGSKEDTINDGPARTARFAKRDVSAYGFTGKATWSLKDPRNQQFSLVGEFLSGDKASTAGKDEMFDVLWGRWPGWSEMYIYSYVNETGGRIAQLNNLARAGLNWKVSVTKRDGLSLTYQGLFAPEAVPSRRTAAAATAFSYDGHFRGHYTQAVLRHQFNKFTSGHLWAECLAKGDYYQQRHTMVFFRAELLFSL